MQNHAHANPSTSAKATMNRETILQKKKKTQLQTPHEANIDSTLEDIQCHGEKL